MSNDDSLRLLRERSGMDKAELARKSGVSRSTISRWESEATVPNRYTARQVLTALLGMRGAEAWIQEHLDRPTPSNEQEPDVWLPTSGELWKALRVRKGIPLRTLATLLKIRPDEVSRWENGKILPPMERLPDVFALLTPFPDEKAALERRTYLLPSAEPPCPTLDEAERRLADVSSVVSGDNSYPVALSLLCLYRDLSRLAVTNLHADPLRAEICRLQCIYLGRYGQEATRKRWVEAGLRLVKPSDAHMAVWAGLVFQSGYVQGSCKKHVACLSAAIPRWEAPRYVGYRAQARREMADNCWHIGERERAHREIALAVREAEEIEDRNYSLGARLIRARIAIQEGRAVDAFSDLPPLLSPAEEHLDVFGTGVRLLMWVRAYCADGQMFAAANTLRHFYAFATPLNITQCLNEAAALERKYNIG